MLVWPNDKRSARPDWFIDFLRNAIVVATIAFGMGIDKSDIRYVYHYNLPKASKTIPGNWASRP